MTSQTMTSVTGTEPTSHVKVATASLIGTAIEWYDFFLYGTAAALIFNKLFFPTFDPMVGTLLGSAPTRWASLRGPSAGLSSVITATRSAARPCSI
jgi:MFS transporter, MHS family, shikimate and dehydroshikimate transport protein